MLEVLNSLQSCILLLRGNLTAQLFFAYIALTFIALFTQDLIQEVYAGEVFGLSGSPEDEPFAVVLAAGERQIGLMVSRLIGQQEVVVKPLDVSGQSNKAVSGATVRDDGGVSLIVDVNEVFRLAQD